MSINIDKFKNTVNKFATGVTVVTTSFGGYKFGITVNSFTSLSLKPTLLLFNIDKSFSKIEELRKAEYYNINILAENQESIARHFASAEKDNLEEVNYRLTNHNIPILSNCHAVIEAKKEKIIEAGDHYIFIAHAIKSFTDDKRKPLIYYNSKFLKL